MAGRIPAAAAEARPSGNCSFPGAVVPGEAAEEVASLQSDLFINWLGAKFPSAGLLALASSAPARTPRRDALNEAALAEGFPSQFSQAKVLR